MPTLHSEWAGDATFSSSGWEGTTNDFKDYTLPAYFSEFGCVCSSSSFLDKVSSG